MTITSGKDVTLNNDTATDLGASTVSGKLNVTAGGAITDSGNVSVAGTTTLAAGAANNITLDNADHLVGTVTRSPRAKDVTLNNDTATDLGASTVSGKLNVTAGGAITDSGNVSVAGRRRRWRLERRTTLLLDNADHLAGTVTVTSGKDVTLNNDTATDLGCASTALLAN